MYDIIIIGGGPAGITAGIYAARKKLKILFLTTDFLAQPSKTGEIDNWPGSPGISGIDLMQNFEKHLKNFDIEIRESTKVVSVQKKDDIFFVKTEQGDVFESKTAIVCSGALPRTLGVKGEKEFAGKGVSFCSLCDGPFFASKDVVVVGSGNAGLEAVLDLSRYANKIFILEQAVSLRADPLLVDLAEKTGRVEVFLNTQVKEIKGKGKVEEVVVADVLTQEIKIIKTSGVFVEVGWAPKSDFLGELVKKNERGEIVVNQETGQTSQDGLFAAGDCCDSKYKQIILASAAGALAALSAFEYLHFTTT